MPRCLGPIRAPKLHVLVPSFNCADWIERCVDSIARQSYQPTSVLVIDDASTDPEYEPLARKVCQSAGFGFICNRVNWKCPRNLRLGVCCLGPAPDDIIVLLDGDDFFPTVGNTLARLADVYSDPSVWLTYGNYQPHPYDTGQTLASAYPPQVIRDRSFRTAGAHFNHPLTFRKFLWDGLTDADMQTDDGRWFKGGYDFVIMAPMLEMAAPDHFRFLNETLYMYNAVNPISDSTANVPLVDESRQIVRRPKKARMIR